MGNSNKVYRGIVGVAGSFFRVLLYICACLFIIWVGKSAYGFGYDVFNQQPMSPGDGQEVTVVIKKDDSVKKIGETLEERGLIEDANVFWIQERLSIYHGKMQPGTYILSTAYTPDRIMQVLSDAGTEEDEAAS